MALLAESKRKTYFEKLGLGDYNKENIKKLQKKYMRSADVDGIYGPDTDRVLRHVYNCSKVENFRPEEFRCPCGKCTGYPDWMKEVELNHIQTIRSHYGKPMIITSGLRCNYENKRVGGIANSAHKTGYAVDFYMKGITDTIEHRKAALKYIEMLPNHQFTYGACMVDSDGVYRSASGMGNAMHTETHKPDKAASTGQQAVDAAPVQAEWMKNYVYGWESNPTIPKSKYKGTCVTYIACILQRIGVLASGKYIWHDEKGKVYGNNSKMDVIYMPGTIADNKSRLKAGDIIMCGDKYDPGSGSHILIINGVWNGNNPVVWDNHSAERRKKGYWGNYAYSGKRQIIAVVRLK